MGKQPPSEQMMDAAMHQAKQQVRDAQWQLRRRVRNAQTPLLVWDRDEGLAGLQGGILVVEGRGIDVDELLQVAQGAGFGADVARNTREALSLVRIAKYDMIVIPRSRQGGWRVIQDIRRNFPGIRLVVAVRDADEGRELMRQGAYSYLLPNYTADQIATCILSGLHLRRRVCQRLLQGEACDRSCIADFMREGDLEELLEPILEDPELSRERVPRQQNIEFIQKVE